MLDFSDRTRTGISILTSAAEPMNCSVTRVSTEGSSQAKTFVSFAVGRLDY